MKKNIELIFYLLLVIATVIFVVKDCIKEGATKRPVYEISKEKTATGYKYESVTEDGTIIKYEKSN